jgi:benzoylformate decarboxylase
VAPWPSFGGIELAATARSLGCPAVRVERREDLLETLDETLRDLPRRSEPLLVEVAVARDENFQP